MAIKNIIAGGIGFTPGSIKFIPTLGFSIGVGVMWTTAATFLFDSANWLKTAFKLRGHLRATSGTVRARVYDDTADAEIDQINTASASLAFVTSSAMTLVDGNQYTIQFGSDDGASCKWRSFDVFQGSD